MEKLPYRLSAGDRALGLPREPTGSAAAEEQQHLNGVGGGRSRKTSQGKCCLNGAVMCEWDSVVTGLMGGEEVLRGRTLQTGPGSAKAQRTS